MTGRLRVERVLVSRSMTILEDLSTEHCIVEQDGHVVTMTMNRPEKKNALSGPMLAGLVMAYEYIDATDDVYVAILTGAGGNFSSGADLVAMGQRSDDARVNAIMDRGDNPHWKALLRDYRLSVPLIAAVEGYAVAGGTEILQGTDIRVAGESAIFGVWEAKRGLFPLGGSACRLPRQIPYTVAMDILLRCPPVPAPEAKAIGLIGHVVPEGQALARAKELAAEVAKNGPLSTKAILRAWRETEHMSDIDAMQHQDPIGWEVFGSEDAQEGPKAFAEKRAPVYKGK
jgi:enoyl-CoA hydratase/carnithine racemase